MKQQDEEARRKAFLEERQERNKDVHVKYKVYKGLENYSIVRSDSRTKGTYLWGVFPLSTPKDIIENKLIKDETSMGINPRNIIVTFPTSKKEEDK